MLGRPDAGTVGVRETARVAVQCDGDASDVRPVVSGKL